MIPFGEVDREFGCKDDSDIESFHVRKSAFQRPGLELLCSSTASEDDFSENFSTENGSVAHSHNLVIGIPMEPENDPNNPERPFTFLRSYESLNISASLTHARKQGRDREMRIIVPAGVSAVILFFCGMGIYIIQTLTGTLPGLKYASWFIPVLGMFCLLVMVPPTRPVICAFALIISMCGSALLVLHNGYLSFTNATSLNNGLEDDCASGSDIKPCKIFLYDTFFYAVRALTMFWFFLTMTWQWSKAPRRKLNSIWWFTGLGLGVYGLGDFVEGILYISIWKDLASESERAIVILCSGIFRLIVSFFMLLPTTRAKTQAFLARKGSSLSGAAGIAALLEGKHHDDIMLKAGALFRYVTLDSITKEMMASLGDLQDSISKTGHLGEVDVFLSHSWHDSPDRKWASLQQWRQKFKVRNGREPRLWIDKFCLNQTDIRNSLRCLPVFLAGCRKLLIIAGDTYAQRLWCVTEIFVFLEMGASFDQLHFIYNGDDLQTLLSFDANLARCFLPEDEDRLKSFIEVACNGMKEFNAHVRKAIDYSWSHRPSYTC